MGDDVYHNGAFMLAANFGFYSGFQPRGDEPAPPAARLPFDYGTPDGYEFFLNLGPLATVANARVASARLVVCELLALDFMGHFSPW